jgi:hypothetical protein
VSVEISEFLLSLLRTDCTATYPLDESSIDCGFICNDDLSEDMLTFMSDELTISKILGKWAYITTYCSYRLGTVYHHVSHEALINFHQHSNEGKDFSREDWMVWRDFICEGNGYRIFVGSSLADIVNWMLSECAHLFR